MKKRSKSDGPVAKFPSSADNKWVTAEKDIPFDKVEIGAGESGVVSVTPSRTFRMDGLYIDPHVAVGLVVRGIRVDGKEQLAGVGLIPGEMFTRELSDSACAILRVPTVRPGASIELELLNVSDKVIALEARVMGVEVVSGPEESRS